MAFYVPESYADGSPYPELKVQGANREYARMMLFNMSGRESEMTAANSYFYASLVLVSSEPQAAACLGKIGEVEMRHVYMLG